MPPQCIDLRQHLQRDVDVRDALWVVSPLTRALQTFLLSCPMLSTHAMTDRFLRTWPLGTNTADAYHAEMYQPHTSQKARSREADAARSPFAWGRVLAPQNAATPSARECPLRGTERGAPAPAPACPGTADPATPVPGAWSPVRPAWSRAMVPDAAFSPAPAATPSGAPLVMVAAGPSASVTPAPSVRVGRHSVKTVVLPCVTEVMVTPGDVGRPTSCLKEMFQEVMPSGSFEAVGEHWWFRGGAATAEGNSALARRFKYPEPRESLHKRIEVRMIRGRAVWLRRVSVLCGMGRGSPGVTRAHVTCYDAWTATCAVASLRNRRRSQSSPSTGPNGSLWWWRTAASCAN